MDWSDSMYLTSSASGYYGGAARGAAAVPVGPAPVVVPADTPSLDPATTALESAGRTVSAPSPSPAVPVQVHPIASAKRRRRPHDAPVCTAPSHLPSPGYFRYHCGAHGGPSAAGRCHLTLSLMVRVAHCFLPGFLTARRSAISEACAAGRRQ